MRSIDMITSGGERVEAPTHFTGGNPVKVKSLHALSAGNFLKEGGENGLEDYA
jgi:hypothetical protein